MNPFHRADLHLDCRLPPGELQARGITSLRHPIVVADKRPGRRWRDVTSQMRFLFGLPRLRIPHRRLTGRPPGLVILLKLLYHLGETKD